MAHVVFISYSVRDKNVADAVCATLEAGGIRCWIAPRDVRPGGTWADEIVQAIGGSRALVLIFSSHSDNSDMVNRELDIATDCRLAIIPFRIEDILPSGQTRFYLAGKHWLDALTPPLAQHLETLLAAVQPLLDLVGPQEAKEREEGGVGRPTGVMQEDALAAPAPPRRAGPQPQAATNAKWRERRFKLKRWHYLISLAVLGLLFIFLVEIPGSHQEAKIQHIESDQMEAHLFSKKGDIDHDIDSYTKAIFLYEKALKELADPNFAPDPNSALVMHEGIKKDLSLTYFNRGMLLDRQNELKRAVEDLEKAASLGEKVDPVFISILKKRMADKKDKKPGD